MRKSSLQIRRAISLSVFHVSNQTASAASAAAASVSTMFVFLFMTPASDSGATTVCRCLCAQSRGTTQRVEFAAPVPRVPRRAFDTHGLPRSAATLLHTDCHVYRGVDLRVADALAMSNHFREHERAGHADRRARSAGDPGISRRTVGSKDYAEIEYAVLPVTALHITYLAGSRYISAVLSRQTWRVSQKTWRYSVSLIVAQASSNRLH